jgi:hypothetical protein
MHAMRRCGFTTWSWDGDTREWGRGSRAWDRERNIAPLDLEPGEHALLQLRTQPVLERGREGGGLLAIYPAGEVVEHGGGGQGQHLVPVDRALAAQQVLQGGMCEGGMGAEIIRKHCLTRFMHLCISNKTMPPCTSHTHALPHP